jgi:hypothetical protein
MRLGVAWVLAGLAPACFDKPPRPIVYVGALHAEEFHQAHTYTFDAAATQGDAIVVHVANTALDAADLSIAAPGWTFTPIASSGAAASYGAIAPDSQPTTFTVMNSSPNQTTVVLADEFAGADPAGGVKTFDGHGEAMGISGDCVVSIVARNDGDLVWAACTSQGEVMNGDGFALGATTNGNTAEYASAGAPAGTSSMIVMPHVPGTAADGYAITAVTIKPL